MLNVSCINQMNRFCQPTRHNRRCCCCLLWVCTCCYNCCAWFFVLSTTCDLKNSFLQLEKKKPSHRIFSDPRTIAQNCLGGSRWEIVNCFTKQRTKIRYFIFVRCEFQSIFFLLFYQHSYRIIDDLIWIFSFPLSKGLVCIEMERSTWTEKKIQLITQQIHQSCHNPIWLSRILSYCAVLPTPMEYMLIFVFYLLC